MLLSYHELLELVKTGIIENCPESQINGTSIDVTLSNRLLVEKNCMDVIDYSKRDPLKTVEFVMFEPYGFTLCPGKFVLGCTREIFNLPRWLACQYQLKSSMARIGINNLMAGWCDPGWHGSSMTLEIKNDLQYQSIKLHEGDPIGQVIFSRCAFVPEEKSYAKVGRYNMDRTVSGIKK